MVKIHRTHPDYLARARWHDYSSRCIYMVTMSKAPGHSPFSRIYGVQSSAKTEARVELLPLGQEVHRQIQALPAEFPHLRVLASVVMPDHVHLLLFITQGGLRPLGKIVAVFKGMCTRAAGADRPLFTKGFNDKIVRSAGQTDAFFKYIIDNPRRYLARRQFPGYFARRNLLVTAQGEYEVYGNLFLLSHPVKSAVRVSRTFSESDLRRLHAAWNETIRCGGVLVSPFISPREKEVRDCAIASGASLILILQNGLPERYKPSGLYFDLCTQGRLLLVAPRTHDTRHVISRAQSLAANSLATTIATLTPASFTLRSL